MNITETLYVVDREQWRDWLAENHRSTDEIWLIYYKKKNGNPRIPYNDAVEEALCFGWIDSTYKTLDEDRYVQRFSPRRKNSKLSEMNKERIRRLLMERKMTPAGLESIRHHLDGDIESIDHNSVFSEFKIPADILKELKADPEVWEIFNNFPDHYKRIRIGYIEGARERSEEFNKRLRYFLKMTGKNKTFGMIR